MDPLSITASCFALINALSKVTEQVTGFIRDFRESRQELQALSRELQDLQLALDLLKDDTVPVGIHGQLFSMMANCHTVVDEINGFIEKHSRTKGVERAARWRTSGRDEANKLRLTLEAHRGALSLAVDVISM